MCELFLPRPGVLYPKFNTVSLYPLAVFQRCAARVVQSRLWGHPFTNPVASSTWKSGRDHSHPNLMESDHNPAGHGASAINASKALTCCCNALPKDVLDASASSSGFY